MDALKQYAYGLSNGRNATEEAMRAFKDLGIEIGSPCEYRQEISACQIALGWKALPPEYEIEVLSFNSGNSDYSPVVYKDNQLVFTSDRSASEGDDTHNWTGNAFFRPFPLVDLKSNSVTGFDNKFNTENNEGNGRLQSGLF